MHKKRVYLIRHGETEWSLTGRHTGLTDIPLTSKGEKQASLLGSLVHHLSIDHVFVSPSKRAQMTWQLAKIDAPSTTDPLLAEWDYGTYEGMTTQEIHTTHPSWDLFKEGVPRGESPQDVEQRALHVIEKALLTDGTIALFSSGHILRVIAAMWLRLPLITAKHLALSPASLSLLSFEHEHPAIFLWNRTLDV